HPASSETPSLAMPAQPTAPATSAANVRKSFPSARRLTSTHNDNSAHDEPPPSRPKQGAYRRISHVKRHAVQITARDGENDGSSPPIADSALLVGCGFAVVGRRRTVSSGAWVRRGRMGGCG